MSAQDTRANILELCSESEYGSWEFWLSDPEDRSSAEAGWIVEALVELIKEKYISATEYIYVEDGSMKEVQIDRGRLANEVLASMHAKDIVDTRHAYWFFATERGKNEDRLLGSGTL